MGFVSRGNQHLGMLGARQQLLEFLILTRLGIDLGDALQGKTRFLDATPLRTRGFLHTAKLLGGGTRSLKAGAILLECLKRRASSPSIDHGNMVRRVEQALMFMLAA